jgi:hypothetical protein
METRSRLLRKRPNNFLRAIGGMFSERSAQLEAAGNPGPSSKPDAVIPRKQSFFKRRPRSLSTPSPASTSRKQPQVPDDPPPQYSLLDILAQSPPSSPTLDSAPHDQEISQPLPRVEAHPFRSATRANPTPLLNRLRYVDEVDIREPDEAPVKLRKYVTATETATRVPKSAVSASALGSSLDSNSIRWTSGSTPLDTRINTALNTGAPDNAAGISRGDTSRTSRSSERYFDLPVQQPVPVRPPSLSLSSMTSSDDPMGYAILRGSAGRLEQDIHTRFDADYAHGLNFQIHEGLDEGACREYTPEGFCLEEQWTVDYTSCCCMCQELLDAKEFPGFTPTPNCDHSNNICSRCLRRWILSALESEVPGPTPVLCPVCTEPLSAEDVNRIVLTHL